MMTPKGLVAAAICVVLVHRAQAQAQARAQGTGTGHRAQAQAQARAQGMGTGHRAQGTGTGTDRRARTHPFEQENVCPRMALTVHVPMLHMHTSDNGCQLLSV